jgi:hypothetical protein
MIDPNKVHAARGVGLFFLYAFIFWWTFKDNPGNRVIQCGSITLMLFLVMVALMQIPSVPFDYVAWLGPALLLLCMLTMFFLFQQGYRALRGRKIQRQAGANATATVANVMVPMPKTDVSVQRERIQDILLYLIIAVGIVAAAILTGYYQAKRPH